MFARRSATAVAVAANEKIPDSRALQGEEVAASSQRRKIVPHAARRCHRLYEGSGVHGVTEQYGQYAVRVRLRAIASILVPRQKMPRCRAA